MKNLPLVALCILTGCAAIAPPRNHPSVAAILADQGNFDGKVVRLTGVPWLSSEGDVLCSGDSTIDLLRSGSDKFRSYRKKHPAPAVRITGRFEVAKDPSKCPEDLVCMPPPLTEYIRVYNVEEVSIPLTRQPDDPAYNCYMFEPNITQTVDGAEIEWIIRSSPVHLGISWADGKYWRYQYGSKRGVEPATEEDRRELDAVKEIRLRLNTQNK